MVKYTQKIRRRKPAVLQDVSDETFGTKYSRMDQVEFVEDILYKYEGIWSVMRLYLFKFFKGCLPQVLLGPFLNTLSHFKCFI